MTTRIYAYSCRSKVHMTVYTVPENSAWFPEIAYDGYVHPLPKSPRDIIDSAHRLIDKDVHTMNEYIILWFLRKIGTGRMMLEDVELYCDGKRIHLDVEGELIDRWPGGFFRERGELLFY